MLQVSGNVLKQVETFKYLRVFLLGRTEIDTRIRKANILQ